jgi:hypothetical protein
MFDVGLGGGDSTEQIFEEEHVQGLREYGAGDRRAGIGGEIGVDDQDFEELFAALGTYDFVESFAEDAVFGAHGRFPICRTGWIQTISSSSIERFL